MKFKKGFTFIVCITSLMSISIIHSTKSYLPVLIIPLYLISCSCYADLLHFYKRNYGNDKDDIIIELKGEINQLENIINHRNEEYKKIWIADSRKDSMIRTIHLLLEQNIAHEKQEDNSACGFNSKLDAFEYFKMFTDMYVGNEDQFNK